MFVNAYEPIVADMGATSASEWAMEIDKASIDAYVIATDRMRDVLARFRVVALDNVELSPPLDPTGRSTALACKLLREELLALIR